VKPSTLTAAVGLGKLYEAHVLAQKKPTFTLDSKPKFSQIASSGSTQGFRNNNPPTRRLNEAEMKDQRERGLCFNCDEKFHPGHRCKKLFVIEGIYTREEEENDGETDLSAEELEPTAEEFGVPEISLNALTGVSTPQKMRVRGQFKGGTVVILVDTGSTHNFMSIGVARRLGLPLKAVECFKVAMANRERIRSEGRCNGVQVCLNKAEFVIEFFYFQWRAVKQC
jgi:hypothetical protein